MERIITFVFYDDSGTEAPSRAIPINAIPKNSPLYRAANFHQDLTTIRFGMIDGTQAIHGVLIIDELLSRIQIPVSTYIYLGIKNYKTILRNWISRWRQKVYKYVCLDAKDLRFVIGYFIISNNVYIHDNKCYEKKTTSPAALITHISKIGKVWSSSLNAGIWYCNEQYRKIYECWLLTQVEYYDCDNNCAVVRRDYCVYHGIRFVVCRFKLSARHSTGRM